MHDTDFWLSDFFSRYFNGDDPTEVLREPEELKKVAVESTKASANTYFGTNEVKLILMPEQKQ